MRLAFTVDGMPLYEDLLVTDSVEELMLDIDWLTVNACRWQFVEKTVNIRGRTIRLKSRPSKATIRKVNLEETVLLDPGTQVNVPVRLTWNSLKTPSTDSLVEPKQFQKGVLSARTTLPGDSVFAAVNKINASPYTCKVTAGQVSK